MGRLVITHSTYIEGLVPWLKKLAAKEGIKTVTPGVIANGKGRSEMLVIRVTTKTIGGYKLIARKGKETQEIFVITKKDRDSLIRYILETKEK